MSTTSSSSSSSSSSDDLLDQVSSYVRSTIPRMMQLVQQQQVQQQQAPQRNSRKKRKVINRERVDRALLLERDYFGPAATYADKFRRRYRMRKPLFERVVVGVLNQDDYFVRKLDAVGRPGLSTLQKCTAAIRMLAYGCCADAVDEYCRMGESTALECLSRFCDAVFAEFGATYMRRANEDDVRRILAINGARGFPGMLGSIDCMHWTWKNCPTAWHGQFQGKSKTPTLVLEAVATQDTWIWHSFFGVSGKFNDISIVQRSPVFEDLLNGTTPQVEYTVNGHQYTMPYYLTDGIYPSWATFVSAIANPITHMESKFSQLQESCRKDVERAFGVLQARFAIIRNPALAHNRSTLRKIMDCCITLHNMIVEDERHTYRNYDSEMESVRMEFEQDTRESVGDLNDGIRIRRASSIINSLDDYMNMHRQMHSVNTHERLTSDLMQHIWRLR
ncbi:uncharacterized protein [Phyllobates terribilis]|uniref:uncharacterized protein n=1 Tax=Phyllobates terribilis TaxID=111132 RepID=UPI003CCACD3F